MSWFGSRLVAGKKKPGAANTGHVFAINHFHLKEWLSTADYYTRISEDEQGYFKGHNA